MMKTIFIIFLTFSFSTADEVSACFNKGTSWGFSEIVNIPQKIQNADSCQNLCLESPDCLKFTWYTLKSPESLTCLLYGNTTVEYPCDNCVSGPRSCPTTNTTTTPSPATKTTPTTTNTTITTTPTNIPTNKKATMNDIIKIDVGGTTFKSYRSTLMSVPDSLLSKMFDPESSLPPEKLQENGSYFIEGDPKIFEIILNYLRYKVIMEAPGVSLATVRAGAVYFGIQDLVDQIEGNMEDQKKKYMKMDADVSLIDEYLVENCRESKSNFELRVKEKKIHLKVVCWQDNSTRKSAARMMMIRTRAKNILKTYRMTLHKSSKPEHGIGALEMEFEAY